MGLCGLSTVWVESGVVEGKRKVFVLHWFPLEQYPPVMNLCNYFGSRCDWQLGVSTTTNDRGLGEYAHSAVHIIRSRFPTRTLGILAKFMAFLLFPMVSIWRIVLFRPDVLLYIEPHSSFPAFLYCFLFRRCSLFIHYHEYHERRRFERPGMRLVRLFHWFERKFLYRRAIWISQTNANRVALFLEDYPHVSSSKMRVLPNYPPTAWQATQPIEWPMSPEQPLKLLYIGALSKEDTFIESVLLWISSCPALNVTLDVYSNNLSESAQGLFRQYQDSRVILHERPVPYSVLPGVISQFHVGLILYKANTTNYVYNASNKLFEYLTCGLDVWFPGIMLGVKPYARNNALPRVVEVNFEDYEMLNLQSRQHRDGIPNEPMKENCEGVLASLEEEMIVAVRASKGLQV